MVAATAYQRSAQFPMATEKNVKFLKVVFLNVNSQYYSSNTKGGQKNNINLSTKPDEFKVRSLYVRQAWAGAAKNAEYRTLFTVCYFAGSRAVKNINVSKCSTHAVTNDVVRLMSMEHHLVQSMMLKQTDMWQT
jgi:hypothetical protein